MISDISKLVTFLMGKRKGIKRNLLKVGGFFRNCDAVFPLPKKCAENYPEQEILKLCYVLCKQKAHENSKYKA